MKVLFKETKEYGKFIFKSGTIYDLKEEPKGFIQRWIKRGCEVKEDAEKFLPDPRFEIKKEINESVETESEKVIEPEKEEITESVETEEEDKVEEEIVEKKEKPIIKVTKKANKSRSKKAGN